MAKSNPKVPPMEFKQEFVAATPEDAFAAIEDKREGALFMVPFDAIHPIADFNIRIHTPDYEAHIERIAQSIEASGFFKHAPLKVHPVAENGQNLLYLVGGYSRYEAAKRAVAKGVKLTRLPVVATPKGTTLDDLLIGLDRDNDGRPLMTYEKGLLVKRMISNDNDEDEVASALGITKQYVGDLMLLMGSPKRLHNMIIGGEVSANLAIELIKEHGSAKKALEALQGAGATGDKPDKGGQPRQRVTRSQVAKSGGTQKGGKKSYETLIEYLIVLNSGSGAQSAMDFLLRWHEKDADALKELAKLSNPKKGKEKTKNPKDVRIKVTAEMTAEQKTEAKAHNKRVKLRAERKAAKLAAKNTPAPEPAPEADDDPV